MALVITTRSTQRPMSREVGPLRERALRTQSTMLKNRPVRKTAIKMRQPARRRDWSWVRNTRDKIMWGRASIISSFPFDSMLVLVPNGLDRCLLDRFQFLRTVFYRQVIFAGILRKIFTT